MSGTAGVPNTFANAVTATGAQLDANYSTAVAYLNDPTNRNNYAAGGAVTNTVSLTFAPPVVGGYTAGLELTWKWGTTNTGGVVLNANGLGNAALVNPDGTALAAGQATAGSIGKAVYDGTQFIFLASSATPASAAQVSAAVNLVAFVSPGRMAAHPGVARAGAHFNGTSTGTITALYSFGIGTIVKEAAGTYSISLSPNMTGTAYVVVATSQFLQFANVVGGSKSSAGFKIATSASNGTPSDGSDVNFSVFGPG